MVLNENWREGDLSFDFSRANYVINFDKSGKGHGLSHIFKAVDFIVEDQNSVLFIEIKNPENSKIPEDQKTKQKEDFENKLQSSKLYSDLNKKLQDSLIFQGLNEGIPKKKLIYAVFIGLDQLEEVQLSNLKDEFIKKHPILKHQWKKPFSVLFFNFNSWNKYINYYPISRIVEKE